MLKTFQQSPPPTLRGFGRLAALSDRPGQDTEFPICWAFLENSALLVKNRD
nr:MAG TPA: hypothetical protein [Caudoviricetes sp.]